MTTACRPFTATESIGWSQAMGPPVSSQNVKYRPISLLAPPTQHHAAPTAWLTSDIQSILRAGIQSGFL